MSKRNELKFKKMLKKAEFVHADLEYHEELVYEAKADFNEAFLDRISNMSRRERKYWSRHLHKLNDERAKQLLEEAEKEKKKRAETEEGGQEEQRSLVKNKETFVDGQTGQEFYLNPDEIEDNDGDDDKSKVIKKLYRKIASETHPDKLIASGFSQAQVERREGMFKKAKEAYERENWYTLYSIAIDLGISPGDIDEKQISWIEEDIKLTMGRISRIGQLFVWVWYTSSDEQKERVMDQYFKQVYKWEWKS
jgi:hypothetical protein